MPKPKPVAPPCAGQPLTIVSTDNDVLATFPFEVVEALRLWLSRAARAGPLPRRLSILGALRQEGVTYLSRGLAATLAHDLQATVCVVELNWWWPSVLPGPTQPGLAVVLSSEIALEEALVATRDPCVALLPAGDLEPGRRGVAARGSGLEVALTGLGRQFDYLILDVPAIRATSDSLPLSALGSAGCLVVRQGGASIETSRRALEEMAPLPILGVLMNHVRLQTPGFILKLIPES